MAQSLFRRTLKGIKAIGLKVSVLADGCDGSFLPITRAALAKSIREVLDSAGIKVQAGAKPRLVVDVRARLLNLTNNTGVLFKIEASLREPVTIARNKLTVEVDTWRHRSTSVVFYSLPNIATARELVESEVLRQADVFAEDVSLANDGETEDKIEDEEAPTEPPDTGAGTREIICREFNLGTFNMPPAKATAYAKVCGPADLIVAHEQELREWVEAAGKATSPKDFVERQSDAIKAFEADLRPRLEAKFKERSKQFTLEVRVEMKTPFGGIEI